MDYAYYLKGLNLYNERGILNKLTFQDISDRDVNQLKKAFDAFDEVVKDILTLNMLRIQLIE
jgi:outer membrane protein assembly factor BamD